MQQYKIDPTHMANTVGVFCRTVGIQYLNPMGHGPLRWLWDEVLAGRWALARAQRVSSNTEM